MSSRLNDLTVVLLGIASVAACAPSDGEARLPSKAASAPRVTLATAPDQFFTANDVRIRYRIIGNGEPALLLHGYTDNLEMWSGTADSLARDFRVIVPDVRGFGRSSKFDDPSKFGRLMVDDMIGLLDHLQIRDAHVMGYSMGALMTSNMALTHPDRVRTATFVAGPFLGDSAAADRILQPYVRALQRGEGLGAFFKYILPTWPDSAIEAGAAHYLAINDRAALIASLESIPQLMLDLARVSEARTPAVAVVSRADPMAAHSARLADRWPNTKLVVLPNGDHGDIFLLPEVIEEFRALVRRTSN
jgi:pimeloyl-ACP methyl ester carboxylesterase